MGFKIWGLLDIGMWTWDLYLELDNVSYLINTRGRCDIKSDMGSPVYEAVRVNVGNLEAACVFVLVPFL